MIIARYTQSPNEVKAYKIDYSSWLDTGETIASIAASAVPATTPALSTVTAVLVSLTEASLTISSGLVDNDYTVTVTTTTSAGQVKQDCIAIDVRTACE